MNNTEMKPKLDMNITGPVKASTKSMLSQVWYEFAQTKAVARRTVTH